MKRVIDTKIWKTGNSYVITVPLSIIRKFKLKKGDLIEITIRKDEDE